MSIRLSPDGMYYWDGSRWLTTLSPDGSHRWNGTDWVPVPRQAFIPPAYAAQAAPARVPTSWTRPLQLAVAGWYGLSALYSLTLPFWMGGTMSQAMNQSFQHQQQLYPQATPPPPDFVNAMTSMMTGIVWVAAIVGMAICVVVIIGALNRWTWLFYVVLVFLGLGVLAVPFDLVNVLNGGSSYAAMSGVSMPSWLNWSGFVLSIPSTALFVWMLVAAIKRGPWGMTRPVSG